MLVHVMTKGKKYEEKERKTALQANFIYIPE